MKNEIPKYTTAVCSFCDETVWAIQPRLFKDYPQACYVKDCSGYLYLTGHTSGITGPLWPEDGIIMHNCEANPVHFKSRSEATKYAREHNVELGCL